MLMEGAAIAAGGAAGALARWLMSRGVHQWLGRDFPWGTLAVNVAGSFAMGLLALVLTERLGFGPVGRAGVLIGFLGAFTTFSTFAFETVELMGGGIPLAAANVLANVAACLLAVVLGAQVARSFGF